MRISRRTPLAGVAKSVAAALADHGIRAVLTGGACATIYSDGAYSSEDLDFVLDGRVTPTELDEAMGSVGFERESKSDRQALDAALAIAVRHPVKLDRIRAWSLEEGHSERFAEFRRELTLRRRRPS